MQWIYDKHTRGWNLTIGKWQAIVLRVADSDKWVGIVERTTAPPERHESPEFTLPHDARTWCIVKINELGSRT